MCAIGLTPGCHLKPFACRGHPVAGEHHSHLAIRSIVLRALALKSLFELDSVFYAAFMPKQLQVCMKKLKPMQFRNSSCRSQIESLLLLLFFVVVIFGSWHQLVDHGGLQE